MHQDWAPRCVAFTILCSPVGSVIAKEEKPRNAIGSWKPHTAVSRICRSRMGSTVNAPRFQLPLERPSISRPSGEWNDGDYDVLADGVLVGRIMKAARRTPCGK
jgi:hypothetical protein